MDSTPLISVVMPVYNGERYLQRSLAGILRQQFGDFELIVVDDASNDATCEILAGVYDPRLRLLRNEVNRGATRSINIGLRVARGEYIARHDADDISHPERFLRQVAYLQAHPETGLIHSDYHIIDPNDAVLETVSLPEDNAALQESLTRKNIFAHGAIMVRRSLIEKIGGYRELFPVSQDYDLYLRLAEQAELANLPDKLYSFRFHAESISRTRRNLQLSCRQLAWEMASRRRAGQPEGPVPEDIGAAYPPDPNFLFRDARGVSFIYYATGQAGPAANALKRAVALTGVEENAAAVWERWGLAKAHDLAGLHNRPADGEAYLHWFIRILTTGGIPVSARRLMASYLADQAFQQYRAGQMGLVARYARRAMACDYRLATNLGLWKIALRSLLHR